MSGRWNQGPVFASAVSGHYMYFGSSGTVRVVEVEKDSSGNATAWQEVASISTDGVVRDMLIEGDYLYIADGSGWMRVINVRNPANPKLSGKVRLNSEIKSIHFHDNNIYIAAGWTGIHIINVSNAEKPILVNTYKSGGYVLDIVVAKNTGFIAAGQDHGLQIVDLADLSNPKLLSSHEISGSAAGIDSNGEYAYVVNMDDEEPGLHIFDVTVREKPVKIAVQPLIYGAERVRLEGNMVYVAGVANDAGLIVIDVSNPEKPKKMGSWWDSTCSESVTIDNQIAYLAHGDQGLEILDVRDPNDPSVIKHFSAAGRVRGVDTQGQLAFVANGYRGLKIVDVSNHANPVDLSELKTYRALDVDVAGPFAHVADDWAGYKLIDISNPKAPKLVAELDTPGYAEDIFVLQNMVYIADGEGGLRILDLSDPSSPKEVSSVPVEGGYAYEVYVAGDFAYLAAGEAGLLEINVSNPKRPIVYSQYKLDNKKFEVRGVAVEGSRVYVAGGYTGMTILDISIPSELRLVGRFETKKRANNVSVVNNKAYLVDSDHIRVIDVSQPSLPKEIDDHPVPASAAKIHSSLKGVFVAGMESGLLIFEP
ncbi:LVIVD repeat-containing protein [Kangiella sediminilitoris]|nr:hypothetical protein [Kangiella sediminilitoris]